MRRNAWIVAALIGVGVTALFAWRRIAEPPPAATADDYDYEAAFETPAPGSDRPVIRIAEIAGRTPDELAQRLGPAEHCEASLHSSRCSYAPGRTEVVFIDGHADWITVNEPGETPFAPAALARLGLAESMPTERSDAELIWTALPGLREVRVVGDGEHVEFIRIKVRS